MACTITSIPGFELTRSEELLRTFGPKLTDLLSRLLGQSDADRFMHSPRVVVCGTREAFPDPVRELCFAQLIAPYCLYYKPDDILYVAANGVEKPNFFAELIAEAGIVPYDGERVFEKAYAKAWEFLIRRIDLPRFVAQAHLRAILDPLNTRDRRYRAFVHALSSLGEKIFSARKSSSLPEHKLVQIALANLSSFIRSEPRGAGKKHKTRSDLLAGSSLSAVVSVAPFPLPSPQEIFGPEADKALSSKNFRESFTEKRLPWTPGLPPAWTTTPDDTFPIDESKHHDLLADFSLRPFARLQSRLFYPETTGPINAVHTFFADFPQNEREVGVTLPYVTNTMYTLACITHVQVDPKLNWAVIELLRLRPQKAERPIRALSATWGMQASRLKTGFCYSVSLSFWANTLSLQVPKRFIYGTSDKFPILTVPAVFDRRLGKYTFAGVDYIVMRCCIREDTVSVVIPKSALPKGRIKKGQTVALTGFYTVGELGETSFDSNVLEALQLDDNAFRANRAIARFPFSNRGIGLFHQAMVMCSRSEKLRKARLRLMYDAVACDYMPACGRLGISVFGASKGNVATESYAAQLLGKAAVHSYVPALRFLALSPTTQNFVAEDIRLSLAELLAKHFNDSDAQLTVYKHLQNKTEKSDERNLAWLVQSAAGGNMQALYDLARAHALGIGATKNPDLARGLILSALTRGEECTKYWAAGLACLHERFFTLSTQEKETAFKSFARSGLPANILLLGLFYQYGQTGNPQSSLIAFCLYNWVELTLHSEEAVHLRQSVQSNLTPEQYEQLPFFDVWETLNIPRPPENFPISMLTAPLEPGPINLHPFFLEQIDTTLRTAPGTEPSDRLMRQLAFMAENSRPVRLGLLRDNPRPDNNPVRLTAHGAQADCTTFDRSLLLVTALRSHQGQSWDVAGVYPIFQDGTHVSVYLHGAAQTEPGVCALLGLSPFSDTHGPTSSLLVFDPLWPDQHSLYRTNERYKTVLYGLTDQVRPCDSDFFDMIPPEVIQQLKEKHTDVRLAENLVGFSPADVTNALYKIMTTIRAVDLDYTQVFSIPYARIQVDSFLAKDFSTDPFVLYVPKAQFSETGLKVGDRIQAVFELTACIDGIEKKTKVTLN